MVTIINEILFIFGLFRGYKSYFKLCNQSEGGAKASLDIFFSFSQLILKLIFFVFAVVVFVVVVVFFLPQ